MGKHYGSRPPCYRCEAADGYSSCGMRFIRCIHLSSIRGISIGNHFGREG